MSHSVYTYLSYNSTNIAFGNIRFRGINPAAIKPLDVHILQLPDCDIIILLFKSDSNQSYSNTKTPPWSKTPPLQICERSQKKNFHNIPIDIHIKFAHKLPLGQKPPLPKLQNNGRTGGF